jgi:uncharacterized protein (TIGR02147 family)
MSRSDVPNVFRYLDYRLFLAEHYAHRKSTEYGYSYRVFSRRAGCKSTNYPCLVIKGKRNLTEDMASRFAQACALPKTEAAYFCALVAYNQAKGSARERHYARLLEFAQFRKVHRLTLAQAEYFGQWYIPAIRELASRSDFRAEPSWVAERLLPTITLRQAKQALKVLFELGFLVKAADGGVQRAHELVSSGGPLGQQLIAYHRAMLERASAAIDLVPRDEREISSVTVCVSQAKLLELKEQIRTFRKQLLQTAEKPGEFERVVQIGFQLFPISRGT